MEYTYEGKRNKILLNSSRWIDNRLGDEENVGNHCREFGRCDYHR